MIHSINLVYTMQRPSASLRNSRIIATLALKNRLIAFKTFNIDAVVHKPYQPWKPLCVTFVMALPWWCHKGLAGILIIELTGQAVQMTVQVHTNAKGTHTATLNVTDTHLQEPDSVWILILGVSDKIPKPHQAEERLRAKSSPWPPPSVAIHHPELAANAAFPKLASAVYDQASQSQ